MTKLAWIGPFQIAELLGRSIDDDQPWPPPSNGVYVISRLKWSGTPTPESQPLYIGGNTGSTPRFCTRIGDLLADMHGFFDGGTGHHSGGQSLWRWCHDHNVAPGSLFLGWATGDDWCDRCAENALVELKPLLNKSAPPRCKKHHS
jgi:hypothetical protein